MEFGFDQIVDKNLILSNVPEEAIFERYLGVYPRLGDKFVNTLPGRPKIDRTPGCNFFERSDGRLIFKDWAWKTMDCFEAAQQYYGVNWKKTLQQIAEDFGLVEDSGAGLILRDDLVPLDVRTKRHREGHVPIQIKVKDWKPKDLAFWQMADQEVTPDQLRRGGIYDISHFWFDGYLAGEDLTMSFAYNLGQIDTWQIYRPLVRNKRYKFRQSSSSWVMGTGSLRYDAGYVFVTKSNADRFFDRLLGYNTCNTLTETHWFSPEQVQTLESFGRVILLYDNDDPGRAAAEERAAYYNWEYLEYPKSLGKDTKEICKKHGGQVLKDFKDEHLDRLGLYKWNQ